MAFLFGKQKTPKEQMREYKRAIDKSIRELERERTALQRQEKKLINDIKKEAKEGRMDSAKIMAKDLVRTRRYIHKFYKLKSQMQAVSLRLQTMQSNQSMAQAMRGVTKAMAKMNQQMNLPQMQKIMMEFEKQSDQMDMKEEMMNDAMDDVMDEASDEDEEDMIVNQILDEIGINQANQLADVPTAAPGQGVAQEAKAPTAVAEGGGGGGGGGGGNNDLDNELQARLDNLRKT